MFIKKVVMLLFVLCAASGALADEKEDAIAAAKEVMGALTAKDYKNLWDTYASTWFKNQIGNNRDSFLANITMTRFPIGKIKSSKVVDVTFSTSDPSTGFKGKIYAVNFANSYETGNSYERIVVIEENGKFRMSGFFGVPAP